MPLDEAIFVKKGLIIEAGQNQEAKLLKVTDAPPKELLRPGVCPQQNNNIRTVLFIGGNE